MSDFYRASSSRRCGGLTTDNLKPRKRIFKVTHSNGVLRRMEPKSQTQANSSALLPIVIARFASKPSSIDTSDIAKEAPQGATMGAAFSDLTDADHRVWTVF